MMMMMMIVFNAPEDASRLTRKNTHTKLAQSELRCYTNYLLDLRTLYYHWLHHYSICEEH